MSDVDTKDLKLIAKTLQLLKNDYGHRIRALQVQIYKLEKRADWIEKLLWLSAGAVISWLITLVMRSL